MTVKTANYFLSEQYTHYDNGYGGEGKTLPYGASVRPIELHYVPAHVKDGRRFDPEREVYCYTRYGIVPIPRNIIQEK